MSDAEHPEHIRDDVYDDDCRACSGERNALIAEMNGTTEPREALALLAKGVRVAKAMYEAPAYGDPTVGEWPPEHPEDLEYWLTRADAAIKAMEQ